MGFAGRGLCRPLKSLEPKAQESFVEPGAKRELVRGTEVSWAAAARRARCQRGMPGAGSQRRDLEAGAEEGSLLPPFPVYAWPLGMPSFSGLLISLPGTGVNSLPHPHRGQRWLGRGTCACWWNEGFRKPGTPAKPVHHLWSWSRAGLVVPWGTPDLQRKHTPEEAEA